MNWIMLISGYHMDTFSAIFVLNQHDFDIFSNASSTLMTRNVR